LTGTVEYIIKLKARLQMLFLQQF